MQFLFADHTLDTDRRELHRGRAQPNISFTWIANHVPIRHDAAREHYLEGFRRVGLD